jgi:mono/diheme cytochrome c family protein
VTIGLLAAATGLVRQKPVLAQQARTVMDGAYTEEQASRGASLYTKECAYCHGAGLRGEGYASPLIGQAFTERWQDGPLANLFIIVKETMPGDRPSALRDEDYADIVAYLLKMNTYPAGKLELSKDPAELEQIALTKPGLGPKK